MGAPKIGGGVELRAKSIRLFFVWDGVRHKETLTIGGMVAAPTAANIKHAHRVAQDIRYRISIGAFDLAEHFPESPRAKKTSQVASRTFGEWCDLWLSTKGRLAKNTLSQYRNALDVWKSMYGADTPIGDLTHAVVAAKVGSTPWKSAKLLNNYLICLRGVFTLAGREMKIDDPMDGIENSKHQAPAPDPLSPEEMEQILGYLHQKSDIRAWAYFEFAFMTGMRPEEIIALRWGDIDWKGRSIRVERARTAGETKALKTYNARDVDLVSRAIFALETMKPWTMLGSSDPDDAELGRRIFENPGTGKPWHDERSQRDTYWRPALRSTGIRWRRPYQTRHTYATNALGAGVNPAYIARQMGHKNAKMLFTVYAKWIDGADRGRELAKLEQMLGNERTALKKAV